MDFAQMQITGPDGGGSTYIDLTYSYWADNTWYCPSPGKIGATTGTWTVDRDFSLQITLYSGDDIIAIADPIGGYNVVGYPFGDDLLNRSSKFTVMPNGAEWGFAIYGSAGILRYCSWQFSSV